MRIITGSAKGIKLIAPEQGTRPLTDRIKTSIFDLISDFIKDANVLDLYAGSGSFGIESLSRGAKSATFIDLANRAMECIETNLLKAKLIEKASVFQTKVNDFITSTESNFDIIFLDPPFDQDLTMDFSSLRKILTKEGIIVYRVQQEKEIDISKHPLEIVYSKQYGKSHVYFIRHKL